MIYQLTTITKRNKVNIEGYITFSKNRMNKIMGGVSISTKKAEAQHVVKIKEGENDDEFIVVRHEKYEPAINVMTIYGEQENRTSKSTMLERWGRILEVIHGVLAKNESLVVLGDFNKHIGSDHLGVAGNHDKITFGGSLVRDLIDNGDLILVNNTEKAEGGPFTRKDPSNPHDESKKSCLDLALISPDLYKYVESLVIDKKEKYEMYRVVVKDGKKCLVSPDHHTLILSFRDIPTNRNKVKQEPTVRFNLKKEEGWENYKALTEECDDLLRIVNDNEKSIADIYEKFEKMHNKIKFKSFGKTRTMRAGNEKTEKHKLSENNEAVIDDIMKKRSNRLESEIQSLKSSSNSRSTRAFKLIETLQGKKKSGLEAVAIIDPVTNELKTSRKEILGTTLAYCTNLLTNNEPDDEYKKDIAVKNMLHDVRMTKEQEHDDVLEDEDFDNAVKRFTEKKKSCYDFLTKAGKDFKDATKILIKRIWDSENIPEGWESTLLIMLYKGRGLRESMDNNRFIHSKEWLPRLFEDLVVSKMKVKVLKKTTKYQIGGMKGHRPTEHLFSIKSIIAYYIWIGKPVLIQCIDIRKFFDKEMLRDALNALYSAGVCGKVYRLWYNLNKNTKITIQTGVGLTDARDTGETLGQGTVGGALASALNLDEELNAHFEDSPAEICYGTTRLQPVSFQDDILRVCCSRDEAQEGYNRFEAVFKSKLLEIHPTKSCFMVFAPNNGTQDLIRQEIANRPIIYDRFEMKSKSEEKWLGDMLCDRGLDKSVEATINNRYGKICSAIFEMKAVIEDLRMQMIGGLKCGLDIWELALIPSLINNCSTLTNISTESVERLDKLQNTFLQMLFSVSQSCPKPVLCWDTATMLMQVRVDKSKLELLHHIKNLDESSLAKQIFNEQKSAKWPGLVAEGVQISKDWNVPDITESDVIVSKVGWKTQLKNEAKKQNSKLLSDMIKKSSKLEELRNEEYGEKDYLRKMSMHDARINFSLRSRMFKCKMNFLNTPQYRAEMWRCDSCQTCIDSQSHVLYCPAYQQLREGKSLTSDQDIVTYFKEVLEIRLKLDIDK